MPLTPRFAGQVALVTGGAQGIGFGIAKRLSQDGARVVLIDISSSNLAEAAATLNNDTACVGAVSHEMIDVTDETGVATGIEKIMVRQGKIDILVQCAGITGKTGIRTEEVSVANFNKVIAVNLRGIFLMCRAVLAPMRKQRYGRIINIASIAGKEGNAGMLAYSASKAAVIGLTKVIGKEYAEDGVTCNAIAPAVVRTPMVDAMPDEQVKYMTDKIPMRRTGEIAEIAALVAFVASAESSFTTAFTFDATGGRATY